MSIVETVLVFAGIPVGLVALFAVVVLGPSSARAPRYRPGAGWSYRPVWYLPRSDHAEASATAHAFGALDGAGPLAVHGSVAEPAKASGGASGEW